MALPASSAALCIRVRIRVPLRNPTLACFSTYLQRQSKEISRHVSVPWLMTVLLNVRRLLPKASHVILTRARRPSRFSRERVGE